MIIEKIKNDSIQALKDKDTIARNILSVVLNKIKLAEIAKREKQEQITDADIVQILQKAIKELEEEKVNYEKVNNTLEIASVKKQIEILKKFLPQMLSESEITKIINSLADKSVPNVMKTFKSQYAGKVDMRLVSEVIKKI